MTPLVTTARDAINGEVVLRGSVQEVFRALTQEQELIRWWGSEEAYTVKACHIDLREGGTWAFEAEDVRGRPFTISAQILRLDPPHFLELRWQASWAPSQITIVQFTLQSEGNATRLKLHHSGFQQGAGGIDTHVWAWRSVLGWAHRIVER